MSTRVIDGIVPVQYAMSRYSATRNIMRISLEPRRSSLEALSRIRMSHREQDCLINSGA